MFRTKSVTYRNRETVHDPKRPNPPAPIVTNTNETPLAPHSTLARSTSPAFAPPRARVSWRGAVPSPPCNNYRALSSGRARPATVRSVRPPRRTAISIGAAPQLEPRRAHGRTRRRRRPRPRSSFCGGRTTVRVLRRADGDTQARRWTPRGAHEIALRAGPAHPPQDARGGPESHDPRCGRKIQRSSRDPLGFDPKPLDHSRASVDRDASWSTSFVASCKCLVERAKGRHSLESRRAVHQ